MFAPDMKWQEGKRRDAISEERSMRRFMLVAEIGCYA